MTSAKLKLYDKEPYNPETVIKETEKVKEPYNPDNMLKDGLIIIGWMLGAVLLFAAIPIAVVALFMVAFHAPVIPTIGSTAATLFCWYSVAPAVAELRGYKKPEGERK